MKDPLNVELISKHFYVIRITPLDLRVRVLMIKNLIFIIFPATIFVRTGVTKAPRFKHYNWLGQLKLVLPIQFMASKKKSGTFGSYIMAQVRCPLGVGNFES